MRVALVYRSFHLAGSLPRGTVELARHLSQHHEVHVFSVGGQTERALAPDCAFHDVPVSHVGDGSRFSARELGSFARNVAALLSREEFDVVHTCAPSTWVSNVLHVPGVARDEARLQGIAGWRYAAAAVRHPGDAVRRLLERKALAYPGLRRIHAAAPSVQDALARRYGIASEHVRVVTPAVNLDEFRPPEDKAAARAAAGIHEPDTFVLLFCGSDFARKGLDRAILALAEARTKTMLLVVGSGPKEPFGSLAVRHGVGGLVRFLGARSDAWRFYQAADALVLPTRADVWGVTPIEAMACGIPPIVSAAAGASRTIDDGETGFVLQEPFEVRALRDAMDALAADPARRQAMGKAGIASAKAHSWVERLNQVESDLVAVAERRLGSEPVGRRVRWRPHAGRRTQGGTR
ncbi:MAG: glycosyltransferase family 4 protein [Actinomycetota bacterium]|nr:glycosyltransferase family 4 protein [Actinomycetota bacterium]